MYSYSFGRGCSTFKQLPFWSPQRNLKKGLYESTYSETAEVCLAQIILFEIEGKGEAAHLKQKQDNKGVT